MLFNVYIVHGSLDRSKSIDEVVYHRCLRASDRIDAIRLCLPTIVSHVLPLITDATIKYISVYAGQYKSVTGNAGRLSSVQIDRSGKFRRIEYNI